MFNEVFFTMIGAMAVRLYMATVLADAIYKCRKHVDHKLHSYGLYSTIKMGLKIKKSPKPVTATQKKQSFAKKSTVSPAKKETHKPLTAKKTEKKQSNKKNVTHTVDAPHENVKIQDPLITSKCELQKSSVSVPKKCSRNF